MVTYKKNVAVVPTLGSQTLLTDIPQILVYQIRQYVMMPKSRSDIYSREIVSLMYDVSEVGYDKQALAKLVEDNLTDMFNRVFAKTMVRTTVTCSTEVIEDTRYQLNILVQATDGNTTWNMAPIVSNQNGTFSIKNDVVAADSV